MFQTICEYAYMIHKDTFLQITTKKKGKIKYELAIIRVNNSYCLSSSPKGLMYFN